MTKLIVMSDTHWSNKGLESIKPLFAENDYILHLGDGVGDVRPVAAEYPDKVYSCAGNCDLFSPYPDEGILEVEGVKIFYCHGHKYGVKNGLESLARAAVARGCALALYGHTHKPLISKIEGVTLINPGSLRYAPDRGGSYCYLIIHKDTVTPVLVGEGVL